MCWNYTCNYFVYKHAFTYIIYCIGYCSWIVNSFVLLSKTFWFTQRTKLQDSCSYFIVLVSVFKNKIFRFNIIYELCTLILLREAAKKFLSSILKRYLWNEMKFLFTGLKFNRQGSCQSTPEISLKSVRYMSPGVKTLKR